MMPTPAFKGRATEGVTRVDIGRIYLDYNAGAPLRPAARAAMSAALSVVGNPSSVHEEGRAARRLIEAARRDVAGLVGGGTVVFAASATEAINLALTPRIAVAGQEQPAGRLYVGATEHPAVLAGGRFGQERMSRIPVAPNGLIDLSALEALLAGHDGAEGRPYIAVQLANSETGVVQPIAEIARRARAFGGYVLCDAAQAAGRVPVALEELGADFLVLSSHKIGGPQGAGALIRRSGDHAPVPAPLVLGGGQEGGARAGTENVAAIAGFGAAAREAALELGKSSGLAGLRDFLEAQVVSISPMATVFGRDAPRLPNTSLFALPGLPAETAVIALDLAGIAVSSGSACSSGKVGASHVLAAMGVRPNEARAGVRVSLGWASSAEHVDRFVAAWRKLAGGMSERAAKKVA